MNTIDQIEWNKICSSTVTAMTAHVKPYLTPISYSVSTEYGVHHGSGSYFEANGEKYLITNEHVAKKRNNAPLTCKFENNENILRLTKDLICHPHPIDLAICNIDSAIWSDYASFARAIPLDRFSAEHNPVKGELLFFCGFSGERSTFFFGNLNTTGTPYLTQESPFPEAVPEADSDYHFSLFYKPDLAQSVDGSSNLPNPHGFSGSLVWDTKRMSSYAQGKEWDPNMATVTGIVWGWPSSSACILATKVEKFNLKELLIQSK